MHWDGNWHMGGMGMWWFLIIPVALAGLGFGVWAVRRRGEGEKKSPEQVLKGRYADGEMDSETYEQMLLDLRR